MRRRRTTVFVLLQATKHWRALEPESRDAALDEALLRVFNGFPGVCFRFYETGALNSRYAAVMQWTADNPGDYQDAAHSLHGCAFFGRPLFEAAEVIIGAEEGWGGAAMPPGLSRAASVSR